MNEHLPEVFRSALAPFAPRSNVVSRVSHARTVVVLEEQSANEGDFTAEDLAAIDAAMHADKKVNGYDARREAAAAHLEANNPIFGGLR